MPAGGRGNEDGGKEGDDGRAVAQSPQLPAQRGKQGEVDAGGGSGEEAQVVVAVAAGEVGAAGQQPVVRQPRRVIRAGEGDAEQDGAVEMVAPRGVCGGDAAESGECGRHAAGDDIRQPGGRGVGGEYRVAGNHPGVERRGYGRQRQFAHDGKHAPPPQLAREDEGDAGGGLRESQSVGGSGEDGAGEVRQAQPRLQAGGSGKAGGDGRVVEAQRGLQAGELEVNQAAGVGDEVVAQAVAALL